MAKANDTWRVLPHRPIEKLSARVWRVEGDLEGMPLKRVMTIAKRDDGKLVVHNAMALDDAAMAEIDAWGPVATIIVPNGYHRLDAKVFADRYKDARVLTPSGARKKVEEGVTVSGSLEDFEPDGTVALETFDGTNAAEGAMVIREPGATTLVLNDTVFNMPHVGGFTGFVLKHLAKSTGGPTISRISRMFVVKDKPAFRSHLERLAGAPDLRRVIVSHHEVIDREPARVLREVASTL
ncbi:MAG: hypothetical protein HOW73_10340 [Polyangiaceae bacterium]|nr:hypothetical protein [Polyangiaceae bacterium]